MARNVRNFYLNADIEGYQNMLSGGPRADGGMSITVTQRNDGCIEEAVTIRCYRNNVTFDDGTKAIQLITSVRDSNGEEVYRHVTYR